MAEEEFFDAKSHFGTPREAALSRAASCEQVMRSHSSAATTTSTDKNKGGSQSKRSRQSKKKTAKRCEQERTQEVVEEYTDFVEASPIVSPTAPHHEGRIGEFIEARDAAALSDYLLSQCSIQASPSYEPVTPLTGAEIAAIRSKALEQPIQRASGIDWLARLRNKGDC